MKKALLLVLAIAAPACVTDPVNVPVTYLEADKACFDVVAPVLDSFIATEMVDDVFLNPVTGAPYTELELEALALIRETWEIRLAAAGGAR